MNRAIVTGSSGFIGRALCARLRSTGVEVITADLDENIDVTNRIAITALITSYVPDVIFHLSAVTTPSLAKTDPHGCYMTNVIGTLNVVSAAPARCRVIVAGTYLPPTEHYSASKACVAIIAGQYGASVLKHSNVYGPGDRNFTRLIPGTIQRLMRNERPVIHNDAYRAFIYIDDLIDNYIALAENPEPCRQLIGPYWYVGAVVTMICRMMNSDLLPIINSEGKVDCEVPDSSKYPFISLFDGLERTIKWHSEQPK